MPLASPPNDQPADLAGHPDMRSTARTWTNALVRQSDATGAASDEWQVRFDRHASHAMLECPLLSIGSGFGVTIDLDVFVDLGALDERLKYVEDTEFFMRLLRAGYCTAPKGCRQRARFLHE